MKVICIDKTPIKTTASLKALSKLVVGETYTIRKEELSTRGNLVYHLEGIKLEGLAYLASRFIPCSNIDEKEILEERLAAYQ